MCLLQIWSVFFNRTLNHFNLTIWDEYLFHLKYVPCWPCLTACLFWKCSWSRPIIPSGEEGFSFKVCIQFCLPQPSLPSTFQSLSPTYISKGGSLLLENGPGVESEPNNQIYMSGGICTVLWTPSLTESLDSDFSDWSCIVEGNRERHWTSTSGFYVQAHVHTYPYKYIYMPHTYIHIYLIYFNPF